MAPFEHADARVSYIEKLKRNFRSTTLEELVRLYNNKPSRYSLFGGGISNDEDEGREDSEAEGDGGTDEDEDKNETAKCEDKHEMDDGDKYEADDEEDEEVDTDSDSNATFEGDLQKKSYSVEGEVEPHRRSYLTSSEGKAHSSPCPPPPPPRRDLQKSSAYPVFSRDLPYSPPLPLPRQTNTSWPDFNKGVLLNPYSASPSFRPAAV